MRAVIQRVSRGRVVVEGKVTGEIGPGLMVLVGVGRDDADTVPATMAAKIAKLRIFDDPQGKMNLSLQDTDGAAPAEKGKAGYDAFVEALRALGVRVETGVFQAHMEVELVNDGPVTILID